MEKNYQNSFERHSQTNYKSIVVCAFVCFILLVSSKLSGDEATQDSINKAILLYDDGNYQESIRILEFASKDTMLTLDEELSARTYLAFSYVALGKRTDAKEQFISIIKKQEGFSLNPEFVSPKIIEVFKEAKKMVKEPNTENIITIREKPPGIARCLVQSSLFPGWGQMSRGDSRKGKFLIGTFSVSVAALALSHLAYLSAENSYIHAETQSDIEHQYSRYNFAYKTRYVMMQVSFLVWLYSITDILLTEPLEENE